MKIDKIQVRDFGAWHELSLDRLEDRATVFYGPNEAGKTTLLNFVRTVLYGFSEKRCARYLPPAQGAQAGGALHVSDLRGDFIVERMAPSQYRGGAGNLRLYSPTGGHQGNELLTSLLVGVDETIFNNVFAVGLTQMQQLATLSDTEAANQLYGLATGADRVSLFDVTRELQAQRDSLIGSANEPGGHLVSLYEQQDRMQRELKAMSRDLLQYDKLRKEHEQLAADVQRQEGLRKRMDGRGDWLEVSRKGRESWSRCLELNRDLAALGAVVDIPSHVVQRLRELTQQIEERKVQFEKLRTERKELKTRGHSLQGRDTLYRHAAELEALDRQRQRLMTIEQGVQLGKKQVEDLEFELQAELEELGLQAGVPGQQLPQISDQVLSALREPARQSRDLRQHVEVAKKIAEDRHAAATRIKKELDDAAARLGGQEVVATADKNRALVSQLQRRIELDLQREDIVRRLDEYDAEEKYWLQRTVLPWRGIVTICTLFSAGAAFVFAGLLGRWLHLADQSRWNMGLIGASLSIASLVIKGAFEQTAQQRAEASGLQKETLFDQQQRARKESDELDRKIPAGAGTLDERLAMARQEIADIEHLLPLRSQLRAMELEAEAADRQHEGLLRQFKESRRGWKASLRTVGLPDTLTPSQLDQMSGRVGDVTQIRARLHDAQRDLRERTAELAAIQQRLDQLLAVSEIEIPPSGIGPQLDKLLALLEQHARSARERDTLKQRFEVLAEQQKRLTDAARRIRDTRQQLLAAHGLTGMKDFRRSQKQGTRADSLRQQRETLLKELAELFEDDFPLPQLRKLLDQRDSSLIGRLDELDAQRETLRSDLGAMHQRLGELRQRLEEHRNDRRRDHKEIQLRALAEKIQVATSLWHRSALASAVIEQVRHNYETKRQPATLAEASRLLERLTENRYQRIWTPLGQNSLCVDDHQGQSMSVEKLSRGTREQVFLALRLALASAYKRRGAAMPMVLDDVFVNFDDQRARAAAKVLAEVAAAGQQMLIFTCHQRIRDIFADFGCDVRDLPLRAGEPPVPPSVMQKPDSFPQLTPTSPTPKAEVSPSIPPMNVGGKIPPPPHVGDLPVYDVESWDEVVGELDLIPVLPGTTQTSSRGEPPEAVISATFDDGETHDWDDALFAELDSLPAKHGDRKSSAPADPQFQPAWRDLGLPPLPDLG